jgi:hypothetical protein
MNNKQIVGGIFCDLRKVLHCTNHRILLSKLQQYGILGRFKALIKSYLTERYQRVVIHNSTNNSSYSDWELVKHGVPQGSVLSPLLFLLFRNNLPITSSTNSELVLYANDTSLVITSSNSVEFSTKVHIVFADVNECFRSNLMSLNFDKTHFLQFQTKYCQKPDLNITLLNKHITSATNIKFLGLVVHEALSWKCYINHILKQLSTVCNAIRTVTPLMVKETLKMIYFSYVHSYNNR